MKITKTTMKEIDSLVSVEEIKSKKTDKKKSPYWVDNKKLNEHFIIYHKKKQEALAQGLPVPPITDNFIGDCIIKIVTGMAYNFRFRNYHSNWKQEMISDGIETAVKYAHNYNPFRYDENGNLIQPNPHAYISMLVYNAFIQRIKREKEEEYIKKVAFLQHGGFAASSNEDMSEYDFDGVSATDFYQSFVSEVAEYEQKMENKKQKHKTEHKHTETVSPLNNFFEIT